MAELKPVVVKVEVDFEMVSVIIDKLISIVMNDDFSCRAEVVMELEKFKEEIKGFEDDQ